MKNSIKFYTATAFHLAFIFLTACNDDTAEAVSPREKQIQMLAGAEGKSWILKSANAGFIDVTQFLQSCDLDNLYILYPIGEGEYASGEEKCDESDPDILETGAWELSEDLEMLNVSLGMISNSAEIVELTENRLQLEFSYSGQTVLASFEPVE